MEFSYACAITSWESISTTNKDKKKEEEEVF